MDLGTVASRLQQKRNSPRYYQSALEFRDDVRQVWCIMYPVYSSNSGLTVASSARYTGYSCSLMNVRAPRPIPCTFPFGFASVVSVSTCLLCSSKEMPAVCCALCVLHSEA